MAQRTMNTLNNQFGSSANGLDRNQYDRNGNPIDTTAVVDALSLIHIFIAVDAHSNEMVNGLNESGKLPVKVVYKLSLIHI